MKKIFVILALLFFASPGFSQSGVTDFAGIWKIIVQNSGGKRMPSPQYILFKSNNYYIWGVDSLGVEPKEGALSGTWLISKEGEIIMISSDSSMTIRYYRPESVGRYRFDATQKGKIKERSQMLEMDIYLEKLPKAAGK